MRRISLVAVSLILAAACAGCFDDIVEAPLEIPDRDLSAPAALAAEAENGSIALHWRSVVGGEEYRVYRSTSDASPGQRIAETIDTFYTDTSAQNGVVYAYRVSAVGESGLEGPLSDAVYVQPGIYAVLINGGANFTSSSLAILTMTAPSATEHMMVSRNADFAGAVWEAFAATREIAIDGPDGAIRVYARFRDAGGALSPVVFDDIVKDTYARVASFEIEPDGRIYAPGETVHFAVGVEGDETGGIAAISISAIGVTVELRDDGLGGDETANDGRYEASYAFSSAARGLDIAVAAYFMDRAGNESPAFDCGTISFTDPPDPVLLVGVLDSTRTSITIQWIASADPHFASYRIYRSETPDVAESPLNLVRELFAIAQTSYPDGYLVEGRTYYYRIFVVNDLGESSGSNEIAASTFDGLPTAPVLAEPSAVGATRATLTWGAIGDTDFKEYRLYRATEPGVTDASLLVATIADRELTYFDDTGLDTASHIYYYRLYAVDLGGKSSRSNEVDTAP